MVKRLFFTAIAVLLLLMLVLAGRERAVDSLYWYRSSLLVAEAGQVAGVPVLMYHRVNPDPKEGGSYHLKVDPAEFERQMRFLVENGYQTVTPYDLLAFRREGTPLPPRSVLLTFDDGYLDNYLYAFPVLQKYGLKATFFIVVDDVGGVNAFDCRRRVQPEAPMMSWEQLRRLQEAGMVIGSHTLTHPHLTQLKKEEARRELMESKRKLEAELGTRVDFFCYPYGNFNDDIKKLVAECGYAMAFSTRPGLVNAGSDPLALPRQAVKGSYNIERFASLLVGL